MPRFKVLKTVKVAVEPPAAVDLPAALATMGQRITGQIDQNTKLLELLKVVAHGPIEQYTDFRHNSVRWVCPVVYEFSAVCYAPGEVYLFTAEAAEARPTFTNAHCCATMTREALASSYAPGDLIPMIVQQFGSIRGQPLFSACVVPWTAGAAREMSFSRGTVSLAEVSDFLQLAASVEAAVAAAAAAARPRELMGIAAPAPSAAKSIAALLREMHAAAGDKTELPLQTLTPAPGWGAVAVTATTDLWNLPDNAVVERPAVALAAAAYRDLALLEVLRELAEVHTDRLERGAQDRVWQIAAQSRGL